MVLFWQWLESRPDRTAVMAEWQHVAGGCVDAVTALLQPLERAATAYPNPRPHGQPMKVVRHAEDDVVAIDPDDYQHRLGLADADIVLYQLNLRAVRSMLCQTLDGVNIAKTPVDQGSGVLQIGNWEPKKSASFPVFLMICRHRGVLREELLQLQAKCDRVGAILLTPSRMNWDDSIDALARSKKMLLVPLAEVIEPVGGAFRETPAWAEYVQGFAQMVKLTLPSNYRNKKPTPMRGTRAANIEKLEKALEKHLIAARDHAFAMVDRGKQPELLPRPEQQELAKLICSNTSAVSRCLGDPRATVLKLLWDTADSLEGVMHYKTLRRR
jgi:hypothetical protein